MPIPLIDPVQVTTNERLASVEATVEQIDKRLTSIESRMASLETRMTWLIGLLFPILVAILGATVTILLNMPK